MLGFGIYFESDLKNFECNQLKKAVQPTYSSSDTLTFLCIRPTKVVHLTYQSCASGL